MIPWCFSEWTLPDFFAAQLGQYAFSGEAGIFLFLILVVFEGQWS